MRKRTLLVLFASGLFLTIVIAQWWMAVRDYALLDKYGDLDFQDSSLIPGWRGSKWFPATPIASYALTEPPAESLAFAKALERIDSVEVLMVFSFGKVDESVWDAMGKIEITEWLDLNYDSVDDKALLSFENVAQVKGLRVDMTKVTDAGLAGIERFISVEEIDFQENEMTDKAIEKVRVLPNLKRFQFGEHFNPHRSPDSRESGENLP